MTDIYEQLYQNLTKTPIHWSVKFGTNIKIGHYVVIDENCQIGDNVVICHGTSIRSNVIINDNSVIGHNCVIESDSMIGSHVTIQPQCYITKFTVVGNHCFFGPGSMSINTYHISHGRKFKPELVGPVIGFGCRIGSGAIIMPGIKLG